ncbi:flagellar protein [Paenibacillus rigui]|uniref:Flagellar protein n=2 Tax=Paenibacillus rigui TaxID=554312 RepID=A0A229UN73_9BACL|nr:flagellar protein [Paenibacillus rigui]
MGMVQIAGFSLVCYGEPGAPLERGGQQSPDFTYANTSSADTFWMIVKVIFFLLLIIGLFFLIIKLLSQKNKILLGRSLRSLGGLPLGQNKSIQVVEIGRSLYIVGVGENVQLLDKIDDEEEIAYITELLNSNHSFNGAGFESVSGWLKQLVKKKDVSEEADITDSFQQVFQHKMQHLSDRKKLMDELQSEQNNTDRLNDKP